MAKGNRVNASKKTTASAGPEYATSTAGGSDQTETLTPVEVCRRIDEISSFEKHIDQESVISSMKSIANTLNAMNRTDYILGQANDFDALAKCRILVDSVMRVWAAANDASRGRVLNDKDFESFVSKDWPALLPLSKSILGEEDTRSQSTTARKSNRKPDLLREMDEYWVTNGLGSKRDGHSKLRQQTQLLLRVSRSLVASWIKESHSRSDDLAQEGNSTEQGLPDPSDPEERLKLKQFEILDFDKQKDFSDPDDYWEYVGEAQERRRKIVDTLLSRGLWEVSESTIASDA